MTDRKRDGSYTPHHFRFRNLKKKNAAHWFLTEWKSIKAMLIEFNSTKASVSKACPLPHQAWYKYSVFAFKTLKAVTQWHPTHGYHITSKCITYSNFIRTHRPQNAATRRLPKTTNHFLPSVGLWSERNCNAHCSLFPSGAHNCIRDQVSRFREREN
jgi:hypothetical protein